MSKGFKPKTRENIKQFQEDAFVLMRAEFEGEEPDSLVKQALVMVEGEHVDSAKKRHIFSAARVQELVENTNAFLEGGGRVPWQRDHKKDQDSNIGDLDGLLEVRVITAKDVPDARLLRKLVGKVGAFATRLVAKGKDVIEQIKAGRISTLSPGIDVANNTIREISATPVPAIVGLRTFRKAHSNFALTFEEAETENADIDAVKEKFLQLTDTFWEIISSISGSTEGELQGQDPVDLQYAAVNGLAERLIKLLQLEEQPEINGDTSAQGQGESNPQYLQKQRTQLPPGGQANMSAYTMADMAKLMYEQQAAGTAEFARKRRGRSRFGRKRRKGGGVAGAVLGRTTAGRLTRVAGLVGAAGVTAGAARYGRGAVMSGIGAYRTQRTPGAVRGPMGENLRAGRGAALGSAFRSAGRSVAGGVKRDVGTAIVRAERARRAVGAGVSRAGRGLGAAV